MKKKDKKRRDLNESLGATIVDNTLLGKSLEVEVPVLEPVVKVKSKKESKKQRIGIAAGVALSSVVGLAVSSPQSLPSPPADFRNESDEDTSLEDYNQPGYSVVNFRRGTGEVGPSSYSDRAPPPVPDSDDSDDPRRDLYARPKIYEGADDDSITTVTDETESPVSSPRASLQPGRQPITSTPLENIPRAAPRSKKRDTAQTRPKTTKQPRREHARITSAAPYNDEASSSFRFEDQEQTRVKMFEDQQISAIAPHRASTTQGHQGDSSRHSTIRLEEQERENNEIIKRLRDKLNQQEDDKRKSSVKLKEKLKSQEELIKRFERKIKSLEEGNVELKRDNVDIKKKFNEVDKARKRYARDNKELADMAENLKMEKKNLKDSFKSTSTSESMAAMKEECDVLKKVVQRLHSELSCYQVQDSGRQDVRGFPDTGPIPSWMVSTKYLSPLLVAYDERLMEKDKLISQYKENLETFQQRTEGIVRENRQLYMKIEQLECDPCPADWHNIQEQAKLVLEENQLLMEQLDVAHNKFSEYKSYHTREVKILTKKLYDCEAENKNLKADIADRTEKYNLLVNENKDILDESQKKYTVEEHRQRIDDLKRLHGSDKEKLENDFTDTRSRLLAKDQEQYRLHQDLSDCKATSKQQEKEIKRLHKEKRKDIERVSGLESQLSGLESQLSQAAKKERELDAYLATVVHKAEEVTKEREIYAKLFEEQERKKRYAQDKILKNDINRSRMDEELKAYKSKCDEDVSSASARLRKKEEEFMRQKREDERSIAHLKRLVQEKDTRIDKVTADKRVMEDEVDMILKATLSENHRMQRSFHTDYHNVSHESL